MIDWHYLEQLFLRLACSDTGKITISLTEAELLPYENTVTLACAYLWLII